MVVEENPGLLMEPCECLCSCAGVQTDTEDGLCLACRHGFHNEDE